MVQNKVFPKSAMAQATEDTYNYYSLAAQAWPAVAGQIAAIIAAVLVATFTGGLLWTSVKQWKVANQGLAETRKAMIVGQRAYLYVSGIRLKRLDGAKVQVTYPIYNGGQTPGTLTGRFIRVLIVDRIPDENPAKNHAVSRESAIVPANRGLESDVINPPYFIDLIDGEAEDIQKGVKRFFLYGFLLYRDIFDLRHYTWIGAAYDGPLEVGKTYYMGFITKAGYNRFD